MTIQYIQNAITHSFSFKDELVQLQFLLKLGDLIYFRQSPCLFLFVGLRSTLPPPVMDFPLFGSLSQSKQLIIALSKSVIRRLHPWMSSMDDNHRWHFSIYGWNFSIHGWNLHPLDFWWKSYASYLTDKAAIQGWRNLSHGWRISVICWCHPWMKKCHLWMKVSPLDVIHGWLFHPWMSSMDDPRM